MRKINCMVTGMLLLLAVAVMTPAAHAGSALPQGDCADCQVSAAEGGEPRWTFIYYLAADNEQESFAENTIAQLMSGTAEVDNHPQVLVLLDRLSVPGTEVFEVEAGEIVPRASAAEQNTADGGVIADFASYALGLAEHENIAFIMKSEGFSWRGIGRDNTHDGSEADQLMSNGDLSDAMILAQSMSGRNVDLLVLEGSIMAFMEVVYELRDAAPLLLATQSKIQSDGLPWDMVIMDLGAVPDMTGEELGRAITDNHLEFYSDKGNNGVPNFDTSINFAALTLFDLRAVPEVLGAHRAWAETTWLLFDEIYNILPHARDLAEVGGFGEVTEFDYNFDIETFMLESLRLIGEEGLSFPELVDAVELYRAAQEDLVLYERSPEDGFKLKAARGLSIWYPPTWNKYDTRDESDEVFGSTMYYEDEDIAIDWIMDSNWLIYLFEYFDRADARLAGNGATGEEPPKKGVFEEIK